METPTFEAGLSEPKKKLLWHLKSVGEAGLEDLAKSLKVSKMAVHKHLTALEQRGLVECTSVRKGVGRPRSIYKLTSQSRSIFPRSYSAIAICALRFIEKNMGRDAIEKVLRERQKELLDKYRAPLGKLDFEGRVKELAKIRDNEGYLAEAKKMPSGKYVLFEHNCPLIHVAQKYWEACTTERKLFEKLVSAKIETTHRAAAGDMLCRFIITKRNPS